MKIYQANHPGVFITGTEDQSLLRQEDQFQGFFSKAVLTKILLPTDCVGIRLYNCGGNLLHERQLIATGVREDGSELNAGAGYIVSATASTPEQNMEKMAAQRMISHFLRKQPSKEKSAMQFISFFSRVMMEQLMAPDAVTGVRIYGTFVKDTTFRTHAGVAVAEAGAAVFDHIVSDLPCPGRCVLNASAADTARKDALSAPLVQTNVADLDTEKYLSIW